MRKYKADLILLDASYPVYSELLNLNDWKIIYKDKISAVFIPMANDGKKWIMPDDDLSPENNLNDDIFESEIAE